MQTLLWRFRFACAWYFLEIFNKSSKGLFMFQTLEQLVKFSKVIERRSNSPKMNSQVTKKGQYTLKIDWQRRNVTNVVIALFDLNYNFECDWLISTTVLNVIGLSNCSITSCPITTSVTSELLENRSFINESQPRKLYFLWKINENLSRQSPNVL